MLSQWDCFLKNLGEWHGSFTRMSPQGKEIEDTPTIVTLEGRDHNQAVHQVVRYLPVNQPSRDLVVDYQNLNRTILFFDNGAFSQGSTQWSSYGQFGGEFSLIEGDRRLRMVQLYDGNKLDKVVLIREKSAHSNSPEKPRLKVEQLLGEWQGKATTIYPDWSTPDTYSTHLKIELKHSDLLETQLSFGTRTITSSATIEDSRLLFKQTGLPIQVLLLPDGASCTCPEAIKAGQPFSLEIGWLLQPNYRQRIFRSYDEKGAWVSCTLVTEKKYNSNN